MAQQTTQDKKLRIKRKIRSRVSGTAARPRLSVYRSNRFIYAQLIDDSTATTLASATDLKLGKMKKMEAAQAVGAAIAALAKEKKITAAVFDRNGFKYAGRISALADAARANGLLF
ncbi:MAG TPA: 50S ribosomal protein L18 [Candidatus Paceibacterota bacterium]|nr:50S ribosomal protein L18 [Candidatus Paceibacterota bacterium]